MRRLVRLLLAALAVLLLPACVEIPTTGPVDVTGGSGEPESPPGIYFDPRPPQPGQSPREIVTGFLEAMKAVPIRTSVAAKFLSTRAQGTWSPEKSTITYRGAGEAEGEILVRMPITGVNRYDASGAWAERSARRELTFSLTSEDGQWRIDELPDALVVPESWFADWYRRASLYYFDPSARILVPEPVFVPEGEQLATSLVRGLVLSGNDPGASARRTFVPEPVEPPLSVPVTPGGVAEVELDLRNSPESERTVLIDQLTNQRMLTQLAWTLQQDPRLRAMRLALGDQALPLPGGVSEVALEMGASFDPNGSQASNDVFALRRGRLVRGGITDLATTRGPFGSQDLGVRSIGVNLAGTRVAGVSGDGTAMLRGSVADPEGRAVEVVSGATDLLPPTWDFAGRVWLVDRDRGRARVIRVVGDEARPVVVPGVSGERVTRFLVSRDGSRLVAVVRGRRGDRLVASRLSHTAAGERVRATRAVPIGHSRSERTRIRDIGWSSPVSVSVLTAPRGGAAQVRSVPVDGAPAALDPAEPQRVEGRVASLVTSPVAGVSPFVVAADRIVDLSAPDRRLRELGIRPRTLTYVG